MFYSIGDLIDGSHAQSLDMLSKRHIGGTSCELRLARVPMFICQG